MSKTMLISSIASLAALAGSTLAGEVTPTFMATNGTAAYVFSSNSVSTQGLSLQFEDQPDSIQAISKDIDGRIMLHGLRSDGSGVWYHLRNNGGNLTAEKFKNTENWYNSFTMVGDRMYAVKNIVNDADEIIELDPNSLAEIGTLGAFQFGIGGIAWIPELNEFLISDTRTNTFHTLAFNQSANALTSSLLGAVGFRWGGNGLEYSNGHVYGTAIRGEDMALVFGEVNLNTGAFEVQRVLGDATRGGVGFGIIPSPGSLAMLGAGGVLCSRRRRK